MQLHALTKVTIYPFSKFGLTGKFWAINIDTLICTWASMLILGLFVLLVRRSMKRPDSMILFFSEKIIEFFSSSINEAFGQDNADCTAFVSGIFFFTLFCNICGVLPFLKEATLDLNTTLAIACVCFAYVQYQGLKAKKFGYITKFFKPVFIFLPINVIGQLSKVASLSFRLFGNIVGGAIIWDLLYQSILVKFKVPFTIASLLILPMIILFERLTAYGRFTSIKKFLFFFRIGVIQLIPATLIFFGLFEGLMHAFIITLLTSMYISSEVGESGH